MEIIKQCPWCDSVVKLCCVQRENKTAYYSVHCRCGASGPQKATQGEAVRMWNRIAEWKLHYEQLRKTSADMELSNIDHILKRAKNMFEETRTLVQRLEELKEDIEELERNISWAVERTAK